MGWGGRGREGKGGLREGERERANGKKRERISGKKKKKKVP